MAQLTVSEAIRISPVGRTMFYSKYVNTGKITVSVDSSDNKYVDSSELVRVFGSRLSDKKADNSEQLNKNYVEQELKAANEQSEVIKLLKSQLAEQKADSEQREQFYQSQITTLTNRLEAPKPRPNPIVRWWRGLGDKTE